MSKMDKQSYMESGGNHCPFCRDENIEGGFIETDSGQAIQHMACNACGAEWADYYNLIDIGSLLKREGGCPKCSGEIVRRPAMDQCEDCDWWRSTA